MALVEADDGQSPSAITSHLFTPPVDRPWARCCICGLSEAAHVATGEEYAVIAPFRCPHCVHVGKDPCPHGRAGALNIKGEPLDEGLRHAG